MIVAIPSIRSIYIRAIAYYPLKFKMLNHFDARSRLLTLVGTSGLTYFVLPTWMLLPTRVILAWDIGVICFLILAFVTIDRATPKKMRRSAQRQDDSRLTIFSLIVIAACASLLAIGFMLKGSKDIPPPILTLHVILAVLTVVTSWLLTHTVFALYYAHLYYRDDQASDTLTNAEGLDFPGDKEPDYWDFLYFSYVIGMTCQVSDVATTSRSMRRLALIHGVLTFFFNTVILALSINIIAGLI
jgi:uncharacterized membrane protein